MGLGGLVCVCVCVSVCVCVCQWDRAGLPGSVGVIKENKTEINEGRKRETDDNCKGVRASRISRI